MFGSNDLEWVTSDTEALACLVQPGVVNWRREAVQALVVQDVTGWWYAWCLLCDQAHAHQICFASDLEPAQESVERHFATAKRNHNRSPLSSFVLVLLYKGHRIIARNASGA
jgi:hypothetical protein